MVGERREGVFVFERGIWAGVEGRVWEGMLGLGR